MPGWKYCNRASTGAYRLASVDGAMLLRFNARANGDVDEVTVSLPASVH